MKTTRVNSIEVMLQEGDAVVQPVSGFSMLPMLDRHTDAVRLVKPDREIEIGDVVMYRSAPKRYILHRVCGIEENAFVIRGDNCVSFERVPKKNIVALMDGYTKNGRYIPNNDVEYRKYVKRVLAKGKPLIYSEWKYIAQLYRAALTGCEISPSDEYISWDSIISICKAQNISSAVSTVITRVSPEPPEEVRRSFSESYSLALRRTLLFDSERSKILRELDKEHIRFIPMKAIVIRTLYPKIGMREFADNDILYDKARQKDLVRIMTSLGYKMQLFTGVHDVFKKEPIFNFEMHKALFADYSPYAKFFAGIFERAIPCAMGSCMSDEDFYLHFVAHYAKHHESAGSGLCPLGDLYLLSKHNSETPEFDRRYVDESLKKLGLVKFEKQMLSISNSLFINGEIDDEHLKYMMSGSAYGSIKNEAMNKIRQKGRIGYLLSRLFFPYRIMKTLFPILETLPFLLPICWAIRIFRVIFIKGKRKTAMLQLQVITQRKPTQPIE